jgi:hypothetical protein
LNFRQHPVDVRKDIVIPEAQNTIALQLKPGRSSIVLLGLRPVLATVKFDDKLKVVGGKIGDVRANLDLPAEMRALQRQAMA